MFSKYTFKQAIGWLMAFVGLACYAVGYVWKYNEPTSFVADIFIKVADVLIIGVVVGYLTGIAQWAGIFKREIQDIVYGKEFLNKRNDIEEIWHNVTKQMFKFKFADIHKKMLSSLKDTLPAEDDISYYDDYDADSKIEWIDKDKGLIKCTDNYTMYIVAESEKPFKYSISKSVIHEPGNNNDPLDDSLVVKVDGVELTNMESNRTQKGNLISIVSKVPLSGKKRYFIQYSRVQQYNIKEDYFLAYKAKYITNNIKVSLELPPDIEAIFIERGTIGDFQSVKNTKSHIKMIYKGVIFPKQGYIFALKVK